MTQVESYLAQRAYAPARKPSKHRVERIEMRALVWATYPLFLGVAAASRLGLTRFRYAAAASGRPVSVFTEARQTAEATIPAAFRG